MDDQKQKNRSISFMTWYLRCYAGDDFYHSFNMYVCINAIDSVMQLNKSLPDLDSFIKKEGADKAAITHLDREYRIEVAKKYLSNSELK